MAYRILLVDDELPALRLVQSIIQKHAPEFDVVQMCTSGEKGYEYLQANAVDLLITDISMKKMNGIELAKLARGVQENLHIIILSGYAEFEYAQGAIQANVDDYLLKPVGIAQVKLALEKIKAELDQEYARRTADLLPAIACDLPFDKESLAGFWLQKRYLFALIHWGGLNPRLPQRLRATTLIHPVQPSYYALRGRDDEEQIWIFPEVALDQFLSELSVRVLERSHLSTRTVIYQPIAQDIVMLPQFLSQALPALGQRSIIGKFQLLPVSAPPAKDRPRILTPGRISQLHHFCATNKYASVKEDFLTLASELEKAMTPQQDVWSLLLELVLSLATVLPSIKSNYDRMVASLADLFSYASSYGELLASAYAVLFEDESASRDRKLSTKELYDFSIAYIDENYPRQMSVQSICDELGISPTYLSRLFRKYSDTTFNNCLMRRRMEAAKTLLLEHSDMLLKDIAACVGYDDSSYFSRVFHQYTGQTPSQYAASRK